MKKYIISCVLFVVCALSVKSQNILNLNNIPDTKFPCIHNTKQSKEPPLIQFNNPTELSKFFSQKAQSNLSMAQGFFWAGIACELVGSILTGINASEGMELAGSVIMLGGGICEVVAVSNIIGHFKWDYRRKQVDLYLSPAGATLKF